VCKTHDRGVLGPDEVIIEIARSAIDQHACCLSG
jgi:hypothetical protein